MSHHRAKRDVHPSVVFVAVPEAGSQKFAREVKPNKYPANQREHWRPKRDIPRPPGKAERLARFLDSIAEQDRTVREMLRPNASSIKAWVAEAYF
jgi:hypothetical protein